MGWVKVVVCVGAFRLVYAAKRRGLYIVFCFIAFSFFFLVGVCLVSMVLQFVFIVYFILLCESM